MGRRVKLPDSPKKKSFYGHSYREVKGKISQYKQSPVPTKLRNDAFYQIMDEWLKQKQTMVKISTFNKAKQRKEKEKQITDW